MCALQFKKFEMIIKFDIASEMIITRLSVCAFITLAIKLKLGGRGDTWVVRHSG